MMKHTTKQKLLIFLTALLALSTTNGYGEEGGVSVSYLYNLSNFTGILPLSWADIAVDVSHDEVYVLPGNAIKVFNNKGMEVYSFNDSGEIEGVADVAVDDEGNIIVLTYSQQGIIRCNYRGEPIAKMELQNLPPQFAGFSPSRIFFRKGSFYFASLQSKQVIVTDRAGLFKDGYDIASILKLEEDISNNEDAGIVGLSVDQEGNILFTMPVIARAFVLAPDKRISSFGQPGGRPGRFGVVGGIAADASGKFILVADTLRCVVMVFDRTFKFHTEFGFRGLGPGNLVGPMQLAVDGHNRVYVAQLRNRGVSVYQITIS
jgi:DNA-binding beta-propeller fold protein YncE